MNATRAHNHGVRASGCTVISNSEKHRGYWRVVYDGREVTRFPPSDVEGATQFVAALRRIERKEILATMT